MTGLLVRCADCRAICLCHVECVCGALDDTGTHRCHSCTDAHDLATA